VVVIDKFNNTNSLFLLVTTMTSDMTLHTRERKASRTHTLRTYEYVESWVVTSSQRPLTLGRETA
jgi:hypothetical protein